MGVGCGSWGWCGSGGPFALSSQVKGKLHLVNLEYDTSVRGHPRLLSDSCLENLEDEDGLAACSDGQGLGSVVALGRLPLQSVGA